MQTDFFYLQHLRGYLTGKIKEEKREIQFIFDKGDIEKAVDIIYKKFGLDKTPKITYQYRGEKTEKLVSDERWKKSLSDIQSQIKSILLKQDMHRELEDLHEDLDMLFLRMREKYVEILFKYALPSYLGKNKINSGLYEKMVQTMNEKLDVIYGGLKFMCSALYLTLKLNPLHFGDDFPGMWIKTTAGKTLILFKGHYSAVDMWQDGDKAKSLPGLEVFYQDMCHFGRDEGFVHRHPEIRDKIYYFYSLDYQIHVEGEMLDRGNPGRTGVYEIHSFT